jgi:hypothetical protein
MSDNFNAYAKRLSRKLEIIKLDAKHRKQDQLVHDIGECLTLLAKLEKEHGANS